MITYEKIVAIMEKAVAEKCDIGVAYDMLKVEDKSDELVKAMDVYKANYDEFSQLRNLSRMTDVKTVCDFYDMGKEDSAKAYLEALKEEGVLK